MLAIRLQRLGRKGYPTYRLAIQEAQRHPSSGRVVAYVGSYNPHTKEAKVDSEKVEFYLKNGAQPTPRVVKILKDSKIKLPDWVQAQAKKERTIKNAEKLRKNRPAEPKEAEPEVTEEAPAEEPAVEETPAETAEVAEAE